MILKICKVICILKYCIAKIKILWENIVLLYEKENNKKERIPNDKNIF